MNREALYGVLDTYIQALASNNAAAVPFAAGVKHTENNVEMPVGDGAWGTVTGIGGYTLRAADAAAGQACHFGVMEESGMRSPFALRIRVDGGQIVESELVVARPGDSGFPFVNADLEVRPELEEMLAEEDRTPREEMVRLAEGYFETLQQNDGTLHTVFAEDCERRENGTQTTNNLSMGMAPVTQHSCKKQFELGFYRFNNWVRARRHPLVDEEKGIVLSAGFIDHNGQLKRYTLTDGRSLNAFFLRPHSFCMLEIFKFKRGVMTAVEAVFHFVPYRMPSPWIENETR